jgi:hypothetical protein
MPWMWALGMGTSWSQKRKPRNGCISNLYPLLFLLDFILKGIDVFLGRVRSKKIIQQRKGK